MQTSAVVLESLNPVTLVVMANRLDGITREMTNTMVRAARSTTMAGRDFSCSVTSASHEMLSAPEGVPVHVFGSSMLAEAMARTHPDFCEGDVFMSNDPYDGNSHAADQTLIVPVFVEGEHVFTALAKFHQVDIGNALPTTYSPTALDVYNEGALIFPCVKIQSDYENNTDVLRMCARRIRSYDIWYGDFLAALGAVRLAERRLKEFCAQFGVETVRKFVVEWLDYSERMAIEAIRGLPSGEFIARSALDPFPRLPDGIPLQAAVSVDPADGRITVDLRDNPDCVPAGLNLTESTARNAATIAVLMVLNTRSGADRVFVPNNSGAFRRITVHLRENCVVGIPRHPASTSVATNTVQDRVMAAIVAAHASLGEGIGAAEPAFGSPPFGAVLSGVDQRENDEAYIFQVLKGTSGGPGTATADGWLTYAMPGAAGLTYIDSTEILEQKYPIIVWENEVRRDSEGAGRQRGALGNRCSYSPLKTAFDCHYFMDGVVTPPRGVRGGESPATPEVWLFSDQSWTQRNEVVGELPVGAGETVLSLSSGGGGYGSPLDRDPALVLDDVADDFISVARARDVYGVVLTGDPLRWETLRVDETATEEARRTLRASRGTQPSTRVGWSPRPWWPAIA